MVDGQLRFWDAALWVLGRFTLVGWLISYTVTGLIWEKKDSLLLILIVHAERSSYSHVFLFPTKPDRFL